MPKKLEAKLSACVLGVKATSLLDRTIMIFICSLLNHSCSAMQYKFFCAIIFFTWYADCKVAVDPCCKDLLSNEPPTPVTKSLDWFWHVSKTNFKLNAYCVKSLASSATHHALGRVEFLVSTSMFQITDRFSRPSWTHTFLGINAVRCGNNSLHKVTAHYPGEVWWDKTLVVCLYSLRPMVICEMAYFGCPKTGLFDWYDLVPRNAHWNPAWSIESSGFRWIQFVAAGESAEFVEARKKSFVLGKKTAPGSCHEEPVGSTVIQ